MKTKSTTKQLIQLHLKANQPSCAVHRYRFFPTHFFRCFVTLTLANNTNTCARDKFVRHWRKNQLCKCLPDVILLLLGNSNTNNKNLCKAMLVCKDKQKIVLGIVITKQTKQNKLNYCLCKQEQTSKWQNKVKKEGREKETNFSMNFSLMKKVNFIFMIDWKQWKQK